MKKSLFVLVATILLTSCSGIYSVQKKSELQNNNPVFANDAETIGLQNLDTRVVVYCRSNFFYSSEDCAKDFESKGFTRFRDIPYKTANYDFLRFDTYPTRRWRDHELTPRW